jgi:hypothetical protein
MRFVAYALIRSGRDEERKRSRRESGVAPLRRTSRLGAACPVAALAAEERPADRGRQLRTVHGGHKIS